MNRKIYLCLGLIGMMAVTYQVRQSIDLWRDWSGESITYSLPVELEPASRVIGAVGPRAAAVGLQVGDEVAALNGHAFRGWSTVKRFGTATAIVTIVREEGGGRREYQKQVAMRPETGLFSSLQERLLRVVLTGAMPWLCLLLALWACLIRPRDPQAWLLFSLLLSFPHMVTQNPMHWENGLRQFGIIYHAVLQSVLPAAMVLFGVYFAERFVMDRRFPWAKWLVIIPGIASGAAVTCLSFLGSESIDAAPRLQAVLRQIGAPFGALLFVSIGLFFMTMGWKMGVASGCDARRRLQLLMYGTNAAMAPMFILILASLFTGEQVTRMIPTWLLTIALLMLFLFPLTITYVIVVHRALDVRVVLRQGIQYGLAHGGANILMGVTVVAVVLWITFTLDGKASPARRMSIVGQGIFIVVLLQRMRLKLAAWIDRRFFRNAYDAERILSELSEDVRTMVDAGSLLKTVGEKISESLFVPRVAFLITEGNLLRPAYSIGYETEPGVEFPESAALVEQIRRNPGPMRVYFDDRNSWIYQTPDITEQEREKLRVLESQLILPLAVKEKLLGFISLGQKKSEEPYSGSDLRLLRSLASQTGLALENSRLTAAVATEAAQRERLNREVEIAREVQERLFPQSAPELEGFDCAGGCRPALGVGGDYYDFLKLPGDRLGIVVGDVAGKGIAAALLMASLQASVRGQMLHAEQPLATIITHVNTLIYEASTSSRYATLFYAQLDTKTLRLDYVNAGHNPPILLRASGEVEELKVGGTVVGLLPRFPYEQASVQLYPGDLLVAFTDGISEAQNLAEDEWGEQRLIEAVRKAGALGAADMIPFLIREADAFVDGAPQHDDMTLVILRVGAKR